MGIFSHKEAIQVSWANDFNRRANVVPATVRTEPLVVATG